MRPFLPMLFFTGVFVTSSWCAQDEAVGVPDAASGQPIESIRVPVSQDETPKIDASFSEDGEGDDVLASSETSSGGLGAPEVNEDKQGEFPESATPKAKAALDESEPNRVTGSSDSTGPTAVESEAPAFFEEKTTPPPTEPAAESPSSPGGSETSRAQSAPATSSPIVVQVDNDELISRMAVMEQFLVAQHEREIALYRDTIRLVIVFGVGFAVVAGLGLLAACFLNYRAIVAVQAVVLRHPADEEGPAVGGLLPQSSSAVPGIERVQASGTRFQSRMSQLEDRLNEIEHMTSHDGGDTSEMTGSASEIESPPMEAPPPRRVIPRAAIMVHKAQTLMNLGKHSDALSTLDEAATLDGPNSEVHLARGQALEKLGRIPDAIEAYDRAVEIDQSNTNALLMKAGALNRQEKFNEALECYERALEVHRTVS